MTMRWIGRAAIVALIKKVTPIGEKAWEDLSCFLACLIKRKQFCNLAARRWYTPNAFAVRADQDHTVAAPGSGEPFRSIADNLHRPTANIDLFLACY
jgi:hypothetical protein